MSFPVQGGVGGENRTCRQIDPNTYNKTSGGCGYAKSSASCSKLAFFANLGGKSGGGKPSISVGGDPNATKSFHQLYFEMLQLSVKVKKNASMPWKKVMTTLRI